MGRSLLPLLLLALAGCPEPATPVNLPAPVEVTSLGPGDTFVLEIVGEDKLPKEYTVAPDGSVDVPYIHRVQVSGLEPQQISALVREQLMAKNIMTDPSVTVAIKEYKSKRIVIDGEVKKADALAFRPGMTLMGAISQAGGLTPLAKRDKIVLKRHVGGEVKEVVIDYDAIASNEIPDVPLQAGDTIYVQQRVF